MKILLVSRECPPHGPLGGIGSYVSEITPAFAALGHETHVLTCVQGELRQDYESNAVQIHVRPVEPASTTLFDTALARRIAVARSVHRFAAELGEFDVVEFPDWMCEGLLIAAEGRWPTVCHLHTSVNIVQQYVGTSGGAYSDEAGLLEKVGVSLATAVTGPSELIVDTATSGGWLAPDQPSAVIPYAIDGSRWISSRDAASTDPVCLFVGKLEIIKRPELLVEALFELKTRGVYARAVFIGAATLASTGERYDVLLRDMARRYGIECTFVGVLDRHSLIRYYESSRVVVIPSMWEGFSMVGLEAMSMSRPVVCSIQTGIAPIVKASESGSVVLDSSARAFADELEVYFRDPSLASLHGRNGRRASANLSPQYIASRRITFFEHICNTDISSSHRRPRYPDH